MALEEKFTRSQIAWILQEQWLYERRKKTRQECTIDLYICNNSLSFFSIMLQPWIIHVRKLEIWLLIDSIHSMVSQPCYSTVFNNLNIWWLFPLSLVLSSSALKVPGIQRPGRWTGWGASERHHCQGSPRPSRLAPFQAPGRPTPRCWRRPVRGQPSPALNSPALWGYRHSSTNTGTLSWWTPTTTAIAGCMRICDWQRYWPALMASTSPAFRGSPWPSGSGPATIPFGLITTTRCRWTLMTRRRRSIDTGRPCHHSHRHCAAVETSWRKVSCRPLPAWCFGENSLCPNIGTAANCERDQQRASASSGRSAWGSAGSSTLQWLSVPTPACFYTFQVSPSFRPSLACH